MPSPNATRVIAVKCDNATDGDRIVVRNLTSGGKAATTMNANGEAAVDVANFSTWNTGDIISIERQGRFIASITVPLNNGRNPTKQVLTTAADARPSIML